MRNFYYSGKATELFSKALHKQGGVRMVVTLPAEIEERRRHALDLKSGIDSLSVVKPAQRPENNPAASSRTMHTAT